MSFVTFYSVLKFKGWLRSVGKWLQIFVKEKIEKIKYANK